MGDTQFLVFDVQSRNDLVLNDSFAGDEVDVPHADSALETGLLHRVVQSAAEDDEDIDIAALRQQMTEGGGGGGQHGQVGIEADDFRKSHQATGSRAADYMVTVDKGRGLQLIQACIFMPADKVQSGILDTRRHKKSRLVLTGIQI